MAAHPAAPASPCSLLSLAGRAALPAPLLLGTGLHAPLHRAPRGARPGTPFLFFLGFVSASWSRAALELRVLPRVLAADALRRPRWDSLPCRRAASRKGRVPCVRGGTAGGFSAGSNHAAVAALPLPCAGMGGGGRGLSNSPLHPEQGLLSAPLEKQKPGGLFLGIDLCAGEGETLAPTLPPGVVPDASLSTDQQPRSCWCSAGVPAASTS